MNTYAGDVIDRRLAEGRPAFVAYLPVGYPTVEGSIEAATALVGAGADIIELGFPYTDPTMDGKIIQDAAQKALDRGVTRSDMFRAVEAVAATGAATLIMTYYNPIFRYGVDNFARDMANAGGAGLITPDLIPEEAGDWIEAADQHNLDKVFLVAPTSTDERIKLTAEASRGFVYAASRMGVTGVQSSVGSSAESLVARTRAQGAPRVCVGIGVSNGEQAKEVGAYADGVIVGSALIKPLLEDDGDLATGIDAMVSVAKDISSGIHDSRK